MKVVTLDQDKLRAAVEQLCAAIDNDRQAPKFGAIVAIASGGVFVADILAQCGQYGSLPRFTIGARRGATVAKRRSGAFLSRLPRCVTDALRICESRLLSAFSKPRPRQVAVEPELAAFLRGFKGALLVVDDAVDSGATAMGAVSAIKELAPSADVRLAVLTVTTRHPIIRPDYTIYDNLTLLRFPWAADF